MKHKNETKQLLAKVQAMKHAVPKGDKKKKKQVTSEIAILEVELETKQNEELQEFHAMEKCSERIENVPEDLENELAEQSTEPTVKISKNQKRRDRKLQEEREQQKRIELAEAENVNCLRNVEAELLSNMLSEHGLQIKEISPDGNCLYSAMADQLSTTDNQYSWKILRSMAANQLRNNKNQFVPFMTHPTTGEPYTDIEFYKYCDDVEGTNVWGGHLEIQALSQALGLPVEIFQASSPVLKVGEHLEGKAINLSYHRHAYGLGEHYNSVIAQEKDS